MSFISDFISGFKEYVTQTWKNRPSTETPMSAERLNHIESGIKSISDAIKSMASAIMKDMADLTLGAADWDSAEGEPGYVQNRTHWVEIVSRKGTVVEETSVKFVTSMASVYGIGTGNIIAGKPYIVYWNGTPYECEAFMGGQSVLLGNGYLVSTSREDTGEPFGIEMLSEASAFVVKATSDAETITIKIETPEVVVYHTLDPNFIPPGLGGGGVTSWNNLDDRPFGSEIVELLPSTTLTFDDGTSLLESSLGLTHGMKCEVYWNGVKYECESQLSVTEGVTVGCYIGNADGTTNEPFIIIDVLPEFVETAGAPCVIMAMDGSESATVSIIGEVVTKLPVEYTPEYDVFDLTGYGTVEANGKIILSLIDYPELSKLMAYLAEHKKARIKLTFNLGLDNNVNYEGEFSFSIINDVNLYAINMYMESYSSLYAVTITVGEYDGSKYVIINCFKWTTQDI